MRKKIGQLSCRIKKTLLVFLILQCVINISLKAQNTNPYPFSTDSNNLTIWNNSEYIPFFVKGVNLGISVPGTFPGELAASAENYILWFQQIKDAGFNCIRLYTLHYPRFYEILDSFNLANNQNPLLFFQGVWLNEELPGYNHDLYYLADTFKVEINENIDCVHGNKIIQQRFGKAYGTYTHDVSKWCLGYIIGREIFPNEIFATNNLNAGLTNYSGNHFSINNASPAEVWITEMLDNTVSYEDINYNTQRPVSCSSWPTLDPIHHPEEPNRDEDTASIDLSKIIIVDAPAGLFISYHAYPYYPDFISVQSSYLQYSDSYGPNSYLGYLNDLKSHYKKLPLIIAEYGVPSSWAIAHYSSTGMNHGGFDEYNQGLTNIRLLNTIKNSNCGGGVQFAWIDEWFKRTWIAGPTDYNPYDRILWHNEKSAEQNFGIVSFEKTLKKDTLKKFEASSKITYINAEVNYSFFELEIGIKDPLDIPDEMWVCFDTYDSTLGESILPNGDTIPSRSEFAIQITNYSAKLFVTEAYDIFGIWHHVSEPNQLYHSIATDGAPWEIVRLKNNAGQSDVQFIGDLKVNQSFQIPSSKDAVIIHEDKIHLRIPWAYLNVVAPNKMIVFNDDRSTPEKEDTISDGFAISVLYKDQWYNHPNRFDWDTWTYIRDTSYIQSFKTSYHVMVDRLTDFNTPAFAVRDSFHFTGPDFPVNVEKENGLLINDFDIDGSILISLISQNPINGKININNDGSFNYQPNKGFTGYDSLKYCVYDGYTLSKSNSVIIFVETNISNDTTKTSNDIVKLYPNPSIDILNIESALILSYIQIFDINGRLIEEHTVNNSNWILDISNYKNGIYMLVVKINNRIISDKFIKL